MYAWLLDLLRPIPHFSLNCRYYVVIGNVVLHDLNLFLNIEYSNHVHLGSSHTIISQTLREGQILLYCVKYDDAYELSLSYLYLITEKKILL